MIEYQNTFAVANASVDVRTAFIRKTYAHLAGAILAFVAIEFALFQIPNIDVTGLLAKSKFSWLIVLGGFMGVSMLANKWALGSTSKGMQYAGLGLYVVAEALIFLPLLIMAASPRLMNQPQLISQAGIITLGLFAGLTLIAFTTKKDFSFLGGMLKVGFLIAMGLIVASFFFGGLSLGLWFSGAMVLLAAGSILYSTSNIIHHYGTEQYVAASLGLFASVALLFWYVLQILMSLSGRD